MAKIILTFSDEEDHVDFECTFEPQLPPEDKWNEENLTQAQKLAIHITEIILPALKQNEESECPFKK